MTPTVGTMREPIPLPEVHLEVRQGGRSATYQIDHVDFLIGSVAGCDLRLPGADLPSVLCLLARHARGVTLRKLAPTQTLLLNGQVVSGAELASGDRLTIGAVDVFVQIEAAPAAAESTLAAEDAAWREAQREFQAKVQAFRKQVLEFQKERDAYLRQRQDRPSPSAGNDDALSERQRALAAREAEIEQQRQETARAKQELADLRRQLSEHYQERRDRLAVLQTAVDNAARKVQERKRQIDAEQAQLEASKRSEAERQAELEARARELAALVQKIENERKILHESRAEVQDDLSVRAQDLQLREQKLNADRAQLEAQVRQYQSDVLRLDRRQGEVEAREQEIQGQLTVLNEKHARLRAESEEIEKQALALDELRQRADEEMKRLSAQKAEQDAQARTLAQRSAALEGQQAAIASLKSRMERIREEFRRQEQQIEQERLRQQDVEKELESRQRALAELQASLEAEQTLREEERRQHVERGAVLDAAVARFKEAQEKHAVDVKLIQDRADELERRTLEIAQREALVEDRLTQLAQAQERLDAERQALRERTVALTQTEQAREALQEQLRRRAELLSAREKDLDARLEQQDSRMAELEEENARRIEQHQASLADIERQRAALEEELKGLAQRRGELAEHEEHFRRQQAHLQELGRTVAQQQQALAEQQAKNQEEWQRRREAETQAKADFEALRKEAMALTEALPDVELRAGTALDRLVGVRDQMRDQMAEIHAWVNQCQEDLESQRAKLLVAVEQLDQKEQSLRQHQNEHRLAMVAFRQQLIEWQGQVSEIKRLLSRDQRRLERREEKIDIQSRLLDAETARLAEQAEHLEQQQNEVSEQWQEVDRQLVDMREWYRRKMRELAGLPATRGSVGGASSDAAPTSVEAEHLLAEEPDAILPMSRDILSITSPVDAGDERLGKLLCQHQLIDEETLRALLSDARRQRRSLRQVLLTSGVVTLYQLALIEAGDVAGLVLGPVRVIDRIRTTPHESIYRVFDPRVGKEAVLRHLSPESALDALHPDEYRQRFKQCMVEHANVARTLEVLDIDGRPAALQEWLTGLPATDWPPLAAAAGVCYRLMTQAALGLAALHGVGVVHGHLSDAHLLLTADGTLKILGAGEPAWLTARSADGADAGEDLRALGRIVSGWCTPSGVRKGPKTKPLPDSMLAVLERLNAKDETRLTDARELLATLETLSDIPGNHEAWDRLIRYVREHATAEILLRASA
jgi:chromosome segregation ATPase